MTDRPASFVSLREVVDAQVEVALAEPVDDRVFLGASGPLGANVLDFNRNTIALQMPRSELIVYGLVEPTPQERAVMTADSERWRRERAARVALGAEWFSAILDVAGPVGRAMLELHVPDEHEDCKGCGFEEFAGLAWPCATVLAGAEAAGIPEPAGL